MEYRSAPERQWRSVWFTQLSSGVYPTSNVPGVIVPLRSVRRSSVFLHFLHLKGYQWLKERVNSEEGRRQLIKIKELHLLADRLSCTAAQLAIGKTQTTHVCAVQAIHEAKKPFNSLWIKGFSSSFSLVSAQWRCQLSTSGSFYHWPAAWKPGGHAGTVSFLTFSTENVVQFGRSKSHLRLGTFSACSSQILTQMTPQIVTEIDALLGNKPHSKKELRS